MARPRPALGPFLPHYPISSTRTSLIGTTTTPHSSLLSRRTNIIRSSSPPIRLGPFTTSPLSLLTPRQNEPSCTVCHAHLRQSSYLPTRPGQHACLRGVSCRLSAQGRTSGSTGGDGGSNDGDDPGEGPNDGDAAWGGAVSGATGLKLTSSLEDVILLDVTGMRCAGCVSRVREILEAQDPVQAASVNLATETAVVRVIVPQGEALYESLSSSSDRSSDELSQEAQPEQPLDVEQGIDPQKGWLASLASRLAQILTEKGYAATVRPADAGSGASAKVVEAKRAQRLARLKETTKRLAFAWILASACLVHHALHWMGAAVPSWVHFLGSTPVNATLSALALLGPGREIVAEGFAALARGAPDMNSLVGLGATAAFTISAVAAALPSLGWRTFFEEPAMLLGVVLIGRALEERAKLRASADMAALSGLLPPKARLVMSDGATWREVPSETVAVGDHVAVLPGDRIPVDGVVAGGRSTVDESALTGEPLPVTKVQGKRVFEAKRNRKGGEDILIRFSLNVFRHSFVCNFK